MIARDIHTQWSVMCLQCLNHKNNGIYFTHSLVPAMLCAKFQNDWTTAMGVMAERDFARLDLKSVGRIFDAAQDPWSIFLAMCCAYLHVWVSHGSATVTLLALDNLVVNNINQTYFKAQQSTTIC